jgi:hypothetical protein
MTFSRLFCLHAALSTAAAAFVGSCETKSDVAIVVSEMPSPTPAHATGRGKRLLVHYIPLPHAEIGMGQISNTKSGASLLVSRRRRAARAKG